MSRLRLLSILAAAAGIALAATLPAAAQTTLAGPYVSLGGGVVQRDTARSQPEGSRFISGIGGAGVVAAGWSLRSGFRAEVEGSFRDQPLDALKAQPGSGAVVRSVSGSARAGTTAVMANLLYDFDMSSFRLPIRPYFGAGIGYGWLRSDVSATTAGGAATGSRRYDGTAGRVAWQAIGGAAYPLPFLRGVEATGEYRYFALQDVRVQSTSVQNGARTTGTVKLDNDSHTLLLGLRWRFGS